MKVPVALEAVATQLNSIVGGLLNGAASGWLGINNFSIGGTGDGKPTVGETGAASAANLAPGLSGIGRAVYTGNVIAHGIHPNAIRRTGNSMTISCGTG